MDNFQQQQTEITWGVDNTKEEKTKCVMCKFVLIFASIAFCIVLVLIFATRFLPTDSASF